MDTFWKKRNKKHCELKVSHKNDPETFFLTEIEVGETQRMDFW